MSYVDNICNVFNTATDAQIHAGTDWYTDAHNLAFALTPKDVTIAAGVIAVLSPKMRWERNKSLAIDAFYNGQAHGALPANVTKANRIMSGESAESVIGGQKVTQFYRTIIDPTGAHDAVIDRHAYDVAMGRVIAERDRKITRVTYRAMVSAYADAAVLLGSTPTIVQAVTWVSWKERK